ncbi:hypothetical protein GCM10007857_33010 [Bradyrhizobium iriomotense]|uniref:Uncharacterized protein n=1 Tax=Bradyrhizobium iriomotense TaxID=441950 RepID=A0ABQ6B140_9BRAD|nr:hypothetical protein GCM10007857_33010 [Bradyrhizobium iriomotense]
MPRFGYMLEHDRTPVGAPLSIHTARKDGGRTSIGHFLLWRGRISVALDANGRMKGLVGLYRERRKYFKGPHRPRLADLSDSELAIYGP